MTEEMVCCYCGGEVEIEGDGSRCIPCQEINCAEPASVFWDTGKDNPMSYDQWKTASPYDDDPDPIDEAQKWLKRNPEEGLREEMQCAYWIIELLLELIHDETGL